MLTIFKPNEKGHFKNLKMDINNMINVLRKIFGNFRYLGLAVLISVLFYGVNVLIPNWDNLTSFFNSSGLLETSKFFFILAGGFGNTILWSSYISLILISILFGVLFSLITYKTITIKKSTGKVGMFASIGIFLGALAPGCAACGVGLLSIFGISAAAITLLPFQGLELSVLSIGILSFSIFKISKIIDKGNVCEIK